ncbi:peptidase C39 family protein [Pseudomonas aeruginosa]|nr:peptidase C39 family protein [Pseudomonas aeruginosa]
MFLDGVRNEDKKEGDAPGPRGLLVRNWTPRRRAEAPSARLDIPRQLARGGQPLVLISSYRLTCSKAPHWVLVIHYDEDFVYLHDPDVDHSQHRQLLDCRTSR